MTVMNDQDSTIAQQQTQIIQTVTDQQPQPQSIKRLLPERDSNNNDASSSFKKPKVNVNPRWHNQSYMLFLALRQHTDHCLPRNQLIKDALKLDQKISKELGLPKVFRGKTPANSASAILTYNADRYFIPFKPEGSRSTHFKLAYEPGNVDKAVGEYQKWCKKLVEHDWPYCFGVPLANIQQQEDPSCYNTPVSQIDPTEDSNTITESNEEEKENNTPSIAAITNQQHSITTSATTTASLTNSIQKVLQSIHIDSDNAKTAENKEHVENEEQEQKEETKSDKDATTPHQPLTKPRNKPPAEHPTYTLDQLDLSNIPQSWQDIVYIAPSRIPGSGNGLFASRSLPYNTPIGFYFGVPMTEDEFDSLKDRIGRSSQYSIMYRKTVLDATDDTGEPVTDPTSPRFCPFHFMNETDKQQNANVSFVEGVMVNQVICWTQKEIEKDQELFVWYGRDVNRFWMEQQTVAVAETGEGRKVAEKETTTAVTNQQENREGREMDEKINGGVTHSVTIDVLVALDDAEKKALESE